jgi:hypothetical protein
MARFFPLIATSNEAVSHDGNGLCDLLCRRILPRSSSVKRVCLVDGFTPAR